LEHRILRCLEQRITIRAPSSKITRRAGFAIRPLSSFGFAAPRLRLSRLVVDLVRDFVPRLALIGALVEEAAREERDADRMSG